MQQPEQLAIQGKGITGVATTAAAGSVTWLEQANAYIDLASGIIACAAGLLTISWYVYRYIRLRGEDNDKTDSG